jgi:FkbM family methyltransferase
MGRLTRQLLIKLSGNARVQKLLERNVALSQYLMGIGAGSSTGSSGEHAIIGRLGQTGLGHQPLCIFDVGANKGQFLGLIERGMQGSSFHVHAFEPGRSAFQILHEDFGDHPGVTLNRAGLGNQSGEADLFYDQPGSVLASLSRRELDHFGIAFKYSEKVAIDTLDEYCSRKQIGRIDLLKLDVEGHELDVLQGGKRMFAERRVGMATFEFGGCNIDSRTYLRDFHHFFRDHGMNAIYRIAPSGALVLMGPYREAHEQFGTTNFLVMQGKH